LLDNIADLVDETRERLSGKSWRLQLYLMLFSGRRGGEGGCALDGPHRG
jgi:hypothetical protein